MTHHRLAALRGRKAMRCGMGLMLIAAAGAGPARGEPDAVLMAKGDLTSFSLEQLMDLEVTSVSRTPDKYFQAPAAITVITGEDIRRSGATTLAEALRLAPGVQVDRINANQWAIGSRGFASGLSRYTLVLIDGRSVYTPLFAGTYWDAQDTLLEDVDRIEVIRGPGGALWGANAVNGVINIITKKAGETPGLYAAAGGGTEEKALGEVRWGGGAAGSACRVYGKYNDRGDSFARGTDGFDGWRTGQGGFRADWGGRDGGLTFQGDAYRAKEGQRKTVQTAGAPFSRTVTMDGDADGGNLLARWSREGDSPLSLQVVYDHTARTAPDLAQDVDTADADFQHSLPEAWRQRLTYGFSYRRMWEETRGTPLFHFDPDSTAQELLGAFVQDQAAVWPDRLVLTLGAKSERNDYTGWENQPNARLAWTPTENQTLWGAVSRAVRTPSRLDRDPQLTFLSVALPFPAPFPDVSSARYVPNAAYGSEKLMAYEGGYRVRPWSGVLADVSGFFNRYDDIQSLNIGPQFTEDNGSRTRAVLPFFFENKIRGRIYGGECELVWKPFPWWRWEGAYSYLRINLENKGGATDGVTARDREGLVPRHQAFLRASMDLPGGFEFDPMARYVSSLPGPGVPAYWTMDARLGWSPGRDLELSVIGQNLFQARHQESAENVNEIQRGVYGKASWRWRT